MARSIIRSLVLGIACTLSLSSLAGATDGNLGVRLRGVYVAPSESFDSRLSALKPEVSDDQIPLLDLEYFFSPNFSSEVIAGVTRHDIRLNNQYAGSTWLLPPTLTVKYHPLAGRLVSPYLGIGINATLPFKSRLNGVDDFEIDNSYGWAAQLGADLKIADNVYFNLDYKYVSIETQARIGGTKYDLDLNPHLFGVGLGYRF